jgi:hypothetical protein
LKDDLAQKTQAAGIEQGEQNEIDWIEGKVE